MSSFQKIMLNHLEDADCVFRMSPASRLTHCRKVYSLYEPSGKLPDSSGNTFDPRFDYHTHNLPALIESVVLSVRVCIMFEPNKRPQLSPPTKFGLVEAVERQ